MHAADRPALERALEEGTRDVAMGISAAAA
jgi:hypothetical protein